MENKEIKQRLEALAGKRDIEGGEMEDLLNEACVKRILGLHNKDRKLLEEAGRLFELTSQYETARECYNLVLENYE